MNKGVPTWCRSYMKERNSDKEMRGCLGGCDKDFMSQSKGHRICGACTRKQAGLRLKEVSGRIA